MSDNILQPIFDVFWSAAASFGRWLFDALCIDCSFSEEDENLVFINAWNEWAEGNHLEPDQKWGRSFLEATKEAIEKYNKDGRPNNYDAQKKEKYERIVKIINPEKGKLRKKSIYNGCKNVIKNKNVTLSQAYNTIKEAKEELPRGMYYKLIYKFLFYRLFCH